LDAGSKGVYKSIDAGKHGSNCKWHRKAEYCFQTVYCRTRHSNVVYLSGEQPIFGGAFSQSKDSYINHRRWKELEINSGKQGYYAPCNIDPTDHNIIYAAAVFLTGMMLNLKVSSNPRRGNTWRHINTGLELQA